jgi:hypothetical protein
MLAEYVKVPSPELSLSECCQINMLFYWIKDKTWTNQALSFIACVQAVYGISYGSRLLLATMFSAVIAVTAMGAAE